LKCCSADGCDQTVTGDRPFCRLHYFMLPTHERHSLRGEGLAKAIETLRGLEGTMKIIYSCVL
jgi:hypothetical protein